LGRRGTLVKEEHHWLKRSVTGKRGESLGRRGTLVREEHHWFLFYPVALLSNQ
jgi:hypothetical protein